MENRVPHPATQRLLDLLAHEQWVPDNVLRRLRRAAQRDPQGATAGSIARWLVDEGLLDRQTAKRLVKAARLSAQADEDAAEVPPPGMPQQESDEEAELVVLPEDDLGADIPIGGAVDMVRFAPDGPQPPSVQGQHSADDRLPPEPPPRISPTPAPVPWSQAAPPDRTEAAWPEPGSPASPPPVAPAAGSDLLLGGGLDPLEQLLASGSTSPGAPLAMPGGTPAGHGPMVRRGPARPPSGRDVRRSRWDSNLLPLGGGALVLLLLLGWLLLFGIQRQSGDEAFRLANEDYQNGRYAEAIDRFANFLQQHADHPRASLARVRRGLARLRQAVDERRDWSHALSVADEVLRDIRPEKEFAEAQAELRTLLPRIASSLAAQADAQNDEALLQQARQAYELALNPHHVPPALRNEAEYRALEQQLAEIALRLGRDQRRDAALQAIRGHIAQGAPQRAYAEREQLLKVYPMLVGDERLQAAMAEASAAEITLVQFVLTDHEARHDEPAPEVETRLLAHTQGQPIAELQGKTVLAVVDGAVYGFDAETGRPLWRRYLGPEATGFPLRLAGERILLLLPAQGEAMAVEERTGQLAWRQELGGRPAGAVLVPGSPGGLLAVSVESAEGGGSVLLLEAGSGRSLGRFELPQGVDVAPAVDSTGRFVFVPGRHSSLYVLDVPQRRCVAVAYQGHEPHAIRAPLLVWENLLAVLESSGSAQTRLHLWNVRDPAQPLRLPVQWTLPGHVYQPPDVLQQRVAVATDLGAVQVVELRPDEETRPLVGVAERRATRRARTPYYTLLLQSNELLVAGDGLVRYEIQPASGTLQPRWVQAGDDAAAQPLQVEGPWVFHLRQRRGQPGAILAAYQRSDGQRQWETQFAVPLAAAPRPLSDPPRVVAIDRTGVAYTVAAQRPDGASDAAVIAPPVALAAPLSDDQPWLELDGGCAALPDPARQVYVLVVDPAQPPVVRHLRIAFEGAGTAGSYLHKLLLGDASGQVHVLDPATGMELGEPFQAPSAPGASYQWLVCRGDHGDEVLLADQHGWLYVLRMRSAPQPHLAAVRQSSAPLAQRLVVPPACVGDVAYAVDAGGTLLAIWMAELKVQPVSPRPGSDAVPRRPGSQPGTQQVLQPAPQSPQSSPPPPQAELPTEPATPSPGDAIAAAPAAPTAEVSPQPTSTAAWDTDRGPAATEADDADGRPLGTSPDGSGSALAGASSDGGASAPPLRVRLGPVSVGDCVLAATWDDRLICLDDQGQIAWNEPLPHGPLAGIPWRQGDELVCASAGGQVFRLAVADGCLRGEVRDLRQPLGSGPVVCHGRLVVAAHDGNLLQVPWP
jgi:outer membrane protein assembly factor BamB